MVFTLSGLIVNLNLFQRYLHLEMHKDLSVLRNYGHNPGLESFGELKELLKEVYSIEMGKLKSKLLVLQSNIATVKLN